MTTRTTPAAEPRKPRNHPDHAYPFILPKPIGRVPELPKLTLAPGGGAFRPAAFFEDEDEALAKERERRALAVGRALRPVSPAPTEPVKRARPKRKAARTSCEA